MEILFEFAAFLLQACGEFLLQMAFELLAELGLHSVREVFRPSVPTNPFLAAIGYALLGAGAGALSLHFRPALLIHHTGAQIANLFATPFAAGIVMALVGVWRRRRDQQPVLLDRFGYGFLFALSMALVRFVWAARG